MVSLKIMFCQILLCTFLIIIGIDGKPPKAIVRGESARPKEFPYTVGLTINGNYLCCGVIIDATHILTNAHCVEYPPLEMINNMVVISGATNIHNGTRHRIKSIKTHEAYLQTPVVINDIAMIELRAPIEFNEYQKAVDLPTEYTSGPIMAEASGWGHLSHPRGVASGELGKLDMKVIPNNECIMPNITTHDGYLCATAETGSGVCLGDSGCPLVHDRKLIGIVTMIVPCAKGYPDVFMRVDHYLDWIEEARNGTEEVTESP